MPYTSRQPFLESEYCSDSSSNVHMIFLERSVVDVPGSDTVTSSAV